MAQTQKHDHTVVIIGTGFGGTMTAIPLAQKFTDRYKEKPTEPIETILMLERGTWWTTPVSTVQDKEIQTAKFLKEDQKQPVQYWSSQNYFRGFLDIFSRCCRRTSDENIFTKLFKSLRNEDGLYDFTMMGTRGFLGLFGRKSDGVTVLRASGVGGGSLVYSNITIQPPDFVLDDDRWPTSWTKDERDGYYNLARHAIGFSVLSALKARGAHQIPFTGTKMPPDPAINAGLSNIVARTARLKPHWDVVADPNNAGNPRGIKRYHANPAAPNPPDPNAPSFPDRTNALWLDRSRVFQTACKELTSDYGAVDLAINDLPPEDSMLGLDPNGVPNDNLPHNYPLEKSVNYCERQGRCNVGCLPGARHTLNKQLMAAALGKFDAAPTFKNLKIEALCEVDVIRALPEGGYEVQYLKRHHDDPSSFERTSVTADMVIVSAGCLGTNEIMLRSKERGTLPGLSDKVGVGFSTNGDYLAFLEKTAQRASLVRGPVTTSFAHFQTDHAGTGPESARDNANPALFHTVEDQGIPPALASIVGEGLPLIQRLVDKGAGGGFLVRAILRFVKKRAVQLIGEIWRNNRERADFFKSEEERVSNMFAVICMGRDAADGVLRLGKRGETTLRVSKPDGKNFWEDPVIKAIIESLKRLARQLRPDGTAFEFLNPFLTETAKAAGAQSVASAHPLGGCRMAKSVADGVVDQFGHVFDKTKTGPRPFYEGLFIADASIIPTALGVNPSLTISALSLRVVDKIIEELPPKP
jgi:choline dehydrogenase-like flavoprotein